MKEKIYYKNIEGTNCCVIKKKGFTEKEAMVIFKYGSKDTQFLADNKVNYLPFGTAHFLEHKLFEDKYINIFEAFSRLGANANAYTNFNSTAYYFKCSDGFEKSLALLLKMVSSAYFTDENVEKEKGIIKQEIKMYEDDPNWQGYFNLLKCMYQKSGVKENIAGDESSVNKMTPDILYGCYNNFYTKDNAAVICCGDIDAETVFESISQNLSLSDEKNAEIINPDEDEAFVKDFVKRKMNTGQNIFNIGFKESEFSDTIVDRICETKILLDIICGKSSKLYNKMYNCGFIDERFGFEYFLDHKLGFCVFSGSSDYCDRVKDMLLSEIESLKNFGIDENEVIRSRKKHIGEFIRNFNSISNIVNNQAELLIKGTGLDEMLAKIRQIDASKINKRLNSLFKNNLCALSLIEKS